jgi:hypothetical protein
VSSMQASCACSIGIIFTDFKWPRHDGFGIVLSATRIADLLVGNPWTRTLNPLAESISGQGSSTSTKILKFSASPTSSRAKSVVKVKQQQAPNVLRSLTTPSIHTNPASSQSSRKHQPVFEREKLMPLLDAPQSQIPPAPQPASPPLLPTNYPPTPHKRLYKLPRIRKTLRLPLHSQPILRRLSLATLPIICHQLTPFTETAVDGVVERMH